MVELGSCGHFSDTAMGWTVQSSLQHKQEILLALGPTEAPIQWVPMVPSSGIKWKGPEVDQPPTPNLFSTLRLSEGDVLLLPHMTSWCAQGQLHVYRSSWYLSSASSLMHRVTRMALGQV